MGLFTKTKLGIRYDLFDYTVRTWHIDRTDHHAENHKRDKAIIRDRCDIGRNYRDSNPDFIIKIYENREWNPTTSTWVPDGRFCVDFVWPYDSDAEGDVVKKCSVEPEDLKKMADFIYDFIKNRPNSWGTNSTTQTQIGNQYNFNIKYDFNYYIDDKEKHTEKMDFNFVINKFEYEMEGFESFTVEVPFSQRSKQIDQFTDIIMTPVQLKEFADFVYSSLGNLTNKFVTV
jgi:hypothetical protein